MPHHKSFNHNYCNILQYGYNIFSKGERGERGRETGERGERGRETGEREGERERQGRERLILGSPRRPVRPLPEKEAQSLKLKLAVGSFRSMGSILLTRSDDTEISIRATDSVLNNRIAGKNCKASTLAILLLYIIPYLKSTAVPDSYAPTKRSEIGQR